MKEFGPAWGDGYVAEGEHKVVHKVDINRTYKVVGTVQYCCTNPGFSWSVHVAMKGGNKLVQKSAAFKK